MAHQLAVEGLSAEGRHILVLEWDPRCGTDSWGELTEFGALLAEPASEWPL